MQWFPILAPKKNASWHFLSTGFRQVSALSLNNGSRQCWPGIDVRHQNWGWEGTLLEVGSWSILLSVHWALLAQQCGCSSHALSPSPGVNSLLSRAEEPHTAPEVRAHHPFRDLCVHSSDWLSHRDLSGDFAAAVGAGTAPALHTW